MAPAMNGIIQLTTSATAKAGPAAAQQSRKHGAEQRNDDLQCRKMRPDRVHVSRSISKISSSSIVP